MYPPFSALLSPLPIGDEVALDCLRHYHPRLLLSIQLQPIQALELPTIQYRAPDSR